MNCHACKCHVTPVRPKTTWKVFSVAFWVSTLVVAMAFSVIVGLNLLLFPLALGVGMAVGAAARRMGSWTCPRCSAELMVPEEGETIDAVPLAHSAR